MNGAQERGAAEAQRVRLTAAQCSRAAVLQRCSADQEQEAAAADERWGAGFSINSTYRFTICQG